MSVEATKPCNGPLCRGKRLPFSAFRVHHVARDGHDVLYGWCRRCERQFQNEWRSRIWHDAERGAGMREAQRQRNAAYRERRREATVRAIRELLEYFGPLSSAEIAEALGLKHRSVWPMLARMERVGGVEISSPGRNNRGRWEPSRWRFVPREE